MSGPSRLLAVLAVSLALLAASAASAQDAVPTRTIGVAHPDGVAAVDFSAADFATRDVRRRLESGLPQTLVTRVYAYRSSDGAPIAVAVRSCRVVYDLWEEVYRVEVQSEAADRTVLLHTVDEVVDACLVARRMRVGTAADWRAVRGRQAYFAALVELNPLTPDTVHRIRRWLARPGGSRSTDGDAFFGSFVSLFVNRRIADAEATLRFRSQEITAP